MQINDILLLAKQKGIRRGEIRLIIVNGIIKDVEYLVNEWETPRNVDSVVDNSSRS